MTHFAKSGEPILYNKLTELILQTKLYLHHAPRHEKFGLCQEIMSNLYEIYGLVVESQKRYHKKTTLVNLDISHEKLRMFVKLYFDMGYFAYRDHKNTNNMTEALRRYRILSTLIDEVGRMIGGWIKYTDAKTKASETK